MSSDRGADAKRRCLAHILATKVLWQKDACAPIYSGPAGRSRVSMHHLLLSPVLQQWRQADKDVD